MTSARPAPSTVMCRPKGTLRRGAFAAGVHSGRAQVSAAEKDDRPAVGLDRQILRTLEVAVAGRVRWQRKDRELGAVEREDGCIVIVRGRGSQKPDRGLSMRTRRLTELVQDSSLLPLPRPPITVLSRDRVLVQRSVMPIIQSKVLPASMIYTDDYKVYNPLADRGYSHRRINHSAKVYVVGSIDTNTIEGFWSLLKNGIRGAYHSVSRKHLQSYVDEYTFRYNHRRDGAPMFRLVEGQVRRVRRGRYGEYAPIG